MLAFLSTESHVFLGLILGDLALPALGLLLVLGLGAFAFVWSRSGARRTVEPSLNIRPGTRIPRPDRSRPARAASVPAENRTSEKAVEQETIQDLPISRIEGIITPRSIEELAESRDEGLLAAIDELQDDAETDAEIRMIALRVLAGFKSSNSVEALSQIALYDLSTTLRAKAVGMLADFDHESVFETIVLSCADPSREVRAAGARALVKVTFDRGDEWARFVVAGDHFMSRQVARAAAEAGLVERSFERLTLKDERSVYEAFALVYLLVKTGETDKIMQAIREHRDTKTRLALLHILKVANVAEVIPQLSALIAAEPMSSVVADKAREAMLGITAMPVGA